MTNSNIPSKNPADESTLTGMLNTVLRKNAMSTDGQLPAIVISYDRVKNVACVRPLIDIVGTGGQTIQRAQIAAIPVLALGGGGFCVTFPLVAGDTGWIQASDRDISLFMQSLKESKPNTLRIKDFADARFIPDSFRKYTYDNSHDSAAMVIQSWDGSVKITLQPGSVNIKAAAINITGAVNINGNITTTGTITNNGHAVDSTHKHNDPQGGTTGTPL